MIEWDWEDNYDDSCPKCDHYTRTRDCDFCGDPFEGMVDEYDDDPINFSPGSFVRCSECSGFGHHHWCPECGWDLNGKHYINGKPEFYEANQTIQQLGDDGKWYSGELVLDKKVGIWCIEFAVGKIPILDWAKIRDNILEEPINKKTNGGK